MSGHFLPAIAKIWQKIIMNIKNCCNNLAIIWGNFFPIPEDWSKIIENNFTPIPEDWNKTKRE